MSPSRSVIITTVITHAALKRGVLHISPHSLNYRRPYPVHATIPSGSRCPEGMYANPVETRQSHLICSWQTSPGWAGTESRSKPIMSATDRYGTTYTSTNAACVLPRMRRLFELGTGRASPGCVNLVCCVSLNCVCFLTSSNVGSRRPGCCNASTM